VAVCGRAHPPACGGFDVVPAAAALHADRDLREALWFPARPSSDGDAEAHAALAAVNLSALGERLDEEAHWAHVLSPGEQQRVAIARALLNKPDWLFLDEATSALEEDQEGALYRRLADDLGQTTMISIGHRRSLEAYHQRVITVEIKGVKRDDGTLGTNPNALREHWLRLGPERSEIPTAGQEIRSSSSRPSSARTRSDRSIPRRTD
jgi:energy-coupling factor transporter ATP-binding protein EcfA2